MSEEKKVTRPIKAIDWNKVDQLLMAGCHGTEIASHFDMHHETFYNRVSQEKGMGFTAYCAEKRAKGDSLLRAKQFERALANHGDNTMLIWLGKQRLGQSETQATNSFDAEAIAKFNALMIQLGLRQGDKSDSKIADSNIIKDAKS